ncbi:MAG: FIST C-terminal domain-containing protein [Acidobacteriota bacterium]
MHRVLEEAHLSELTEACADVAPGQTALVLIADEGHPPLDEMVRVLRGTGRPFFGGIFPGVISGPRCLDRGAVVVGIDLLGEPRVFEDLASWQHRSIGDELESEGTTARSGLVLIDGLASSIGGWLGAVYDSVGTSIPFVGAGAGSMSLQPSPCLFTDRGVLQDAAIVGLRSAEIGIGVRHGWQTVSGPMVVDSSEGNVIRSLNWDNAFDVYAALVLEESDLRVDPEDFFEVSKGFPFGLQRSGHEVIVRDPIRVDAGGALVCVGEVPENSVLTLLKGEASALIGAAGEAAASAVDGLNRVDSVFLVDCVSRSIFLEERFEEELREIAAALRPKAHGSLYGVLSLGEVASSDDGPLEFLNKTSVVGALGVE